jgi:hypothetical protein
VHARRQENSFGMHAHCMRGKLRRTASLIISLYVVNARVVHAYHIPSLARDYKRTKAVRNNTYPAPHTIIMADMNADFDDSYETITFDKEVALTDVSMSNTDERFASFPAPEEVRTSVWANQRSSKGGGKRHLKLVIAAGVIIAIVISVAVGVGVSSGGGGGGRNSGSDQSQSEVTGDTSGPDNGGQPTSGYVGDTNTDSGTFDETSEENLVDTTQEGTFTTNTSVRRANVEEVVAYMTNFGVSDATAVATFGTPQSRAATWLAEQDGANLAVPTVGIGSLSGYKYMTRYVMAVLFYSTDGINWENPLEFMTLNNVCDWNAQFTTDGQNYFRKGVLCEPQANLISGLLFGKL